ncbi:Hypothetical protein PBC10988_8490 [Planctomycetales bacterium 10988]|nr:Hypothetical protein PBC10988_8490 [Planctomycetales bacterium 10988]
MLGGLTVLFALRSFDHQLNEEIRRQCQEKLSRLFPDLEIRLRSVNLLDGEGILLHDLSIADPSIAAADRSVLQIPEVMVRMPTDLTQLLQGEIDLQEVIVRRPHLTVIQTGSQSCNWQEYQLIPSKKPIGWPRKIIFEGATIDLAHALTPKTRFYRLEEGNFTITPYYQTSSSDPFFTEAKASAGGTLNAWKELRVQMPLGIDFEGGFEGDYLRNLAFSFDLQPETKKWDFQGTLKDLEICPELFANCPSSLGIDRLKGQSVRALVQVKIHCNFQPDRPIPFQFEVVTDLRRGQIAAGMIPYSFDNLNATVSCNTYGITVHQASAKHEEATFDLYGHWQGFDLTQPCSFHFSARSMEFKESLLANLPASAEKAWDLFTPSGTFDVDLDARFDGIQWTPEAKITLRDTAFQYKAFPYRLRKARGSLIYRDEQLNIDVQGYAGSEPIYIQGTVVNPRDPEKIDLIVQGEDLIIDSDVLEAIPESAREEVRKLAPSGKFDLVYRHRRGYPPTELDEGHVDLKFKQGSVRPAQFPYPIYNVSGKVDGYLRQTMTPGGEKESLWRWTFQNLHGQNDTGQIEVHGELSPKQEGGLLRLGFSVADVPLDNQLQRAVPPKIQRLWQSMRPIGKLQMQGEILNFPGQPLQISLKSKVKNWTLWPTFFPYRLEEVQGSFQFEQGVLVLQNCEAQHGNVRVATHGQCDFDQLGNWQLRLEDLAIERVRLSRERNPELFQALPVEIQKSINQLLPSGLIDLQGVLVVQGQIDLPLVWNWDIGVQLQDVSLSPDKGPQHVYGKMQSRGTSKGRTFQSQCDLTLDSLYYQGYQLTEVQGPLWIDQDRLILGALEALEPRANWEQIPSHRNHLTATFLAGRLVGDGIVQFLDSPVFHFRAKVYEASLGRYAREIMPGRQSNLDGKVLASIDLQGGAAGTHLLRGAGRAELREANVYELPFMVSLLSILRLKEPKSQAFSESDVDFRIDGKWVYFDQTRFRGDAISLRGSGTMNHETQEVNLQFYAVAGRDEGRVPIIDKVLGDASQSLLRISVEGKVDDLQVRRDAVPVVSGTLRSIWQELQRSVTPQ